jgi:hypothetical protein
MPRERPTEYQREKDGYTFVLDRVNVDKLKAMPDFEGREEPAVAEDFLRFRIESWAEDLASAGARQGPVAVTIDSHQRKAHLSRDKVLLFSADI